MRDSIDEIHSSTHFFLETNLSIPKLKFSFRPSSVTLTFLSRFLSLPSAFLQKSRFHFAMRKKKEAHVIRIFTNVFLYFQRFSYIFANIKGFLAPLTSPVSTLNRKKKKNHQKRTDRGRQKKLKFYWIEKDKKKQPD